MVDVQTAPHFLHEKFVLESPSISSRIANENTPTRIEESTKTRPRAPSFDESHGEAQVLYLPPLLSSLPHSHQNELPVAGQEGVEPGKNAPLRTETHLPSIDPVSLSLHRALHKFKPLDTQYASRPYGEAFNWSTLELPIDEEREWYCVAFRSKRKPGSESAPLYEQDRLAHEEAVHRGGLIMYWYGVPDPKTGLNLATCVWQSRKFALAANSGPQHILAMRLAAASFAEYRLERYVLKKERGQTGLTVYPYNGGEVGW
ncbi:SubName: Full=Uncharacterized protein {ECO:0000313/EMBL:CCA67560.1} [Serendipita indica DSM 11827]|nr:SubName: Full=Uncharacterized protein {ECO:0000313/EMBL:CCA67560.1} [Serendipita indica DSM 11827]